ncbi:hypothetical protein CHS0354_035460 [Potamilus streckersoni]|uniref:BTB domain-containing protein n=1 Tax=Potamilus streckersoni TaxID=2493646 RepID=A0AAE0TDW2_9BIVA|nr:hypothetical protein CHS0354_035460 [Potamilus streckersoni]
MYTNMYMLTYEIACDVVIIVGEHKIAMRAHKFMLMSRSFEFYKMLSNRLDDHPAVLHFPDVDPEDMREVLSYLYGGRLNIDANKACSILYAAKKFNLKGVIDEALSYLQGEMYSENVCRILEVVHEHEENTVYNRCLKFIHVNAVDVLTTRGFTELCSTCVENVMKPDNLRADEILIFEALLRWADAECARQKIQPDDKNRRTVLGDLVFVIRFPIMDINYFTERLSTSKLLTTDEKLSLYQYYHGKYNPMLLKHFNTNSRISNHHIPVPAVDQNKKTFVEPNHMAVPNQTFSGDFSIQRLHRFDDTSGEWRNIGTDAISFKCSKSIYLHGAIIFGPARAEDTYKVALSVTDDMKKLLGKNLLTISTNVHHRSYDVTLPSAIRVQSNAVITVEILISGGASYRGVKGKDTVDVDGIQFVFINSNRSSSGTDITMGQIPGLLFSLV